MTSGAPAVHLYFGNCLARAKRENQTAAQPYASHANHELPVDCQNNIKGGSSVKLKTSKWSGAALSAVCAVLLGTLLCTAATDISDIPAGKKVKITGLILSRNGDTLRIKDKKSGQFIVVNITDKTKIERKQGHLPFFRNTDMDVTAMVPGLTIEAEGSGDAKGRLEAEEISFNPDEFAMEVAEPQEVTAERKAAKETATQAQQGTPAAAQAQSPADQAMPAANHADADAQTAGAVGVTDAASISMLNKRVSELPDYKNKFEVDVFFARDSAALDEKAKKDLNNLAEIAKSLNGYLIEIAGYSSNTLSKEEDQKVSEERAEVVAHYLRETKDIPLRRILMPVAYGSTHPAVSNKDAYDRELNRHVDIKVLVNQSLGQGE
jgi:outer membrane protein OmpA-like peptidoglycan-associated protein